MESHTEKEDVIKAIQNIITRCDKTPDIIGDIKQDEIILLLYKMIELDMYEEFNKLVRKLRYTSIDEHQNIIPYVINNMKQKDNYKYIDVLRNIETKNIQIGDYTLIYNYRYEPDQFNLQITYNDTIYSYELIYSEDNIDNMIYYANCFDNFSKLSLNNDNIEIIQYENNIILSINYYRHKLSFDMKKI